MKTILFAAGGTGGHVYPAIAIAEEIIKIEPRVKIAFVGTREKIEARVVPQKGLDFHPIWISGFSRRLRLSNLLFPVKVIVSLFQSFFVMQKVKPSVVIGTGGYVCGPVLYVASMMGIPTIVHESNSYPGITTRMLASKVTRVYITFSVTEKWVSRKATVEIVGTPTREELSTVSRQEGAHFFGLSPNKKTVFAFGGSLGASSINSVMPMLMKEALQKDVQIIWQTGETDWQSAQGVSEHPNIKIMKYIDRMDCGYAAADLIISRSGATTLAELTRLGKPAILVPYPFAAANHQEMNAKAMVESGAAIMIADADLPAKLVQKVKTLLEDEKQLSEMGKKSKQLGKPYAGRDIAKKILELIS